MELIVRGDQEHADARLDQSSEDRSVEQVAVRLHHDPGVRVLRAPRTHEVKQQVELNQRLPAGKDEPVSVVWQVSKDGVCLGVGDRRSAWPRVEQ